MCVCLLAWYMCVITRSSAIHTYTHSYIHQGKDLDAPLDVENCPLHLLEYMLPDAEPYKGGSPFKSRAPQPLSPSAANIKASSPRAVSHVCGMCVSVCVCACVCIYIYIYMGIWVYGYLCVCEYNT